MRLILTLTILMMAWIPALPIKIGMVSNKIAAEVYLKNGEILTAVGKMPKEKQEKLKFRLHSGRDTVISAADVDSMQVWSTKYNTGNKFVMRWTGYHDKPGGKLNRPVWIILWRKGPNCSLWAVARKANFGLDGNVMMWHKSYESNVELYWKAGEPYPTMIRNRKQSAEYLADDEVVVEKIKTMKNPPYYMVDQVMDYIPGRRR